VSEVCRAPSYSTLSYDLAGVGDELVLAGDFQDFPQQIHRIQRAGRVVGV
jgi:hypothetical protein